MAQIVTEINIETPTGEPIQNVTPPSRVRLSMEVEPLEDNFKANFGFGIFRNDDLICFGTLTTTDNVPETVLRIGKRYQITLDIEGLALLDGEYRAAGVVADENALQWHHVVYSKPFEIALEPSMGYGVVFFPRKWSIREVQAARR